MFTQEEEEILKLMVAEKIAGMKISIAKDAEQAKATPLFTAYKDAQLALKEKCK